MLAATAPDSIASEESSSGPAPLLAQGTAVLEVLGAGFLEHAANLELRSRIATGLLQPEAYQRQLLWLLFRLLGLLILEERGLAVASPTRWPELCTVFRSLEPKTASHKFQALSGMFAARHCADLEAAALSDSALEKALSLLNSFPKSPLGPQDTAFKITPRQLGDLYEALLELKPIFVESGTLSYASSAETTRGETTRVETQASSRRSRGSYYTPDHLVQIVLKQALEPLITEALARPCPEQALLDLAIVDPACGTGHFLLAAARRLALQLSLVEGTNATEGPSKDALARVISRCIFGVDLDDLAVELCKLSLWLEAANTENPRASESDSAAVSPSFPQIYCGHALLGAPDEVINNASDGSNTADAWCAKFFKSEVASGLGTRELAEQYRFFHWQCCFPEVFSKGGFDLILGNPPWIAHAGRAAQLLPPAVKHFYKSNYEAFAAYPTTHGLFASVLPRYLRSGGRMGLVVPSSLAELAGYLPARRAHDMLCDIPLELTDFGEGQFEGVTQPCMALVSLRTPNGRTDAPLGESWRVARPELSETDRALLLRLKQLPPLPSELFGERGLQSDPSLASHFRRLAAPEERFTTPIREGTDVREFELLTPRYHVDATALGSRLRSTAEYREVRLVVRQTARYPIAALSDGVAFRNSLLAGFASPEWPAEALVTLLNSTLIRWLHFQRFRDARQPILPQVKVAHLRAIPAPLRRSAPCLAELSRLGAELSGSISPSARATLREALEGLIASLYELSAEERTTVALWHARFQTKPQKTEP